jgi:hypothetical protein
MIGSRHRAGMIDQLLSVTAGRPVDVRRPKSRR